MNTHQKMAWNRLAAYIATAVVAYLLGPRVIPSLSDEGTLDMTFLGALFWWLCAILFFVFMLMAVLQIFRVLRTYRS